MNVLRFNRALYRALNGVSQGFETPEVTPIHAPDENDRVRAEEISEGDAVTWLGASPWEWRIARGR